MFYLQNYKKNDASKMIAILIVFAAISFMVISTFNGMYDFSYNIVHIRQWQYLLAAFSGGALGVAGVLLQKLTKNTLSDVSILGIGSLNIICIIVYLLITFKGEVDELPSIKTYLPIVSIAASVFGTGLIYYFSNKNKNNRQNFIIIGISLQFLFEAVNIAILNLVPSTNASVHSQITTEIGNYSYGKFGDVAALSIYPSWRISVIVSFVLIIVICCIAYLFAKKLDVLEINEELAKTYCIRTERLRKFLFLCVALLAGLESALVGTISLLGIIAPNIAKMIFGNRSNTNIFASFFIGAILTLIATFISVNLSQNIPIGILSTAIIVPFFIYLIFFKK